MNYHREVYRKLIHLSWTAIPLSYYFYFSRIEMLWMLGVATGGFLLVELLRISIPVIHKLFSKVFGAVVRESENLYPTGATFTLLGSLITILIFEKEIAVASLLILSLADSSAALIGRKWGNTHLLGKSVEGTIAFFITALLIVFIMPGISIVPGLLGVVMSTIIELIPSPVDDNLTIPLAAAISMTIGNLII